MNIPFLKGTSFSEVLKDASAWDPSEEEEFEVHLPEESELDKGSKPEPIQVPTASQADMSGALPRGLPYAAVVRR